ncbi:MAG: ABC transporter permease [Gemmatimonadota bacterium]
MIRALTWAGALVLALHGLIHLMGATVYMKLGTVEGMPYRTTLLDGHWDLGDGGIRVFGALWAVAAVGFVAAAAGWLGGWRPWQPVLVAATLLSLALTTLDGTRAPVGIAVNLAILVALWLAPQLVERLAGPVAG